VTTKARLYIAWIAAAGLTVLAVGVSRWQFSDLQRFLAFLLLAIIASTLKIHLPRMNGTMSLSFLFILIGIADFSFAETLLLGCTAGLIQSLWKPKQPPKGAQVVFNMATLVLSAGMADWVSHLVLALAHTNSLVLLIALATFVFLLLNTGLVAMVISLAEEKPLRSEWLHCFYWSFPYFLVGAVAAGLVSATSRSGGWVAALLVLPLMYLSHLWYQIHVENVAQGPAILVGLRQRPPVFLRDSEPATLSVPSETQ